MRITVCELPNEPSAFEEAWNRLAGHVRKESSELVLLPEMPFHPWLPVAREFDRSAWDEAVARHEEWLERLYELAPSVVLGSRPVNIEGRRLNEGFVWDPSGGYRAAHTKYYLPDEEGFWEASWYERGDGTFEVTDAGGARLGFQICTDMWFTEHSRALGRQGAHLIAVPRATPRSTLEKWLAGGRVVAVTSGAYSISSNRTTSDREDADLGGMGWIADPDGQVIATTTGEEPYVTVEIQLETAERAKETYPRYVEE